MTTAEAPTQISEASIGPVVVAAALSGGLTFISSMLLVVIDEASG